MRFFQGKISISGIKRELMQAEIGFAHGPSTMSGFAIFRTDFDQCLKESFLAAILLKAFFQQSMRRDH
jgi:hypothetical protein